MIILSNSLQTLLIGFFLHYGKIKVSALYGVVIIVDGGIYMYCGHSCTEHLSTLIEHTPQKLKF